MLCSVCQNPIDESHYTELFMKTKNGSLAPTVTAQLGYVCLDCTEFFKRLADGLKRPSMAPAVPLVPRSDKEAMALDDKSAAKQRRGRTPKPKPASLPCECGCGAPATPGKRFIRGHHFRVKCQAMKGDHK